MGGVSLENLQETIVDTPATAANSIAISIVLVSFRKFAVKGGMYVGKAHLLNLSYISLCTKYQNISTLVFFTYSRALETRVKCYSQIPSNTSL